MLDLGNLLQCFKDAVIDHLQVSDGIFDEVRDLLNRPVLIKDCEGDAAANQDGAHQHTATYSNKIVDTALDALDFLYVDEETRLARPIAADRIDRIIALLTTLMELVSHPIPDVTENNKPIDRQQDRDTQRNLLEELERFSNDDFFQLIPNGELQELGGISERNSNGDGIDESSVATETENAGEYSSCSDTSSSASVNAEPKPPVRRPNGPRLLSELESTNKRGLGELTDLDLIRGRKRKGVEFFTP